MDKVIRMCMIHDLGEIFTGDIPTFLKTGTDEATEDANGRFSSVLEQTSFADDDQQRNKNRKIRF